MGTMEMSYCAIALFLLYSSERSQFTLAESTTSFTKNEVILDSFLKKENVLFF